MLTCNALHSHQGSYNIDKQIAASPRGSISVGHNFSTLYRYVSRQTIPLCILVDPKSLKVIPGNNWTTQFRLFAFGITSVEGQGALASDPVTCDSCCLGVFNIGACGFRLSLERRVRR